MTSAVLETNRRLVPLDQLYLELKIENGGDDDSIQEFSFINPRLVTGLDTQKLEELAAEIKARSVDDEGRPLMHNGKPLAKPLIPVSVVRVMMPSGPIDLVWDGQRRKLASEKAFGKGAMIEVVDLRPEPIEPTPEAFDELEDLAIEVGQHREGLSSYELVMVAARRRARGYTLEEISHKIGRSVSWASRMLAAHAKASKKTVLEWSRGKITDEQFKDLAGADDSAVADVVKNREAGNKAEARVASKERAETAKEKRLREKLEKLEAKRLSADEKKVAKERAKQEAADKKQAAADAKKHGKNGKNGKAPEQVEMWTPPPKVETKPAPKPEPKAPSKKAPSKLILEELVRSRDQRPPTHDYVKGIVDGVRYALGEIEPNQFAKPWLAWIARLGGVAAPPKAKKAPAKKAKLAAKKTAKKPTGKPAKKVAAKKAKPAKKR